jgi:hypothetical protein
MKNSTSARHKQGDHFLVRKLTRREMDSLLAEWANVRTEKPDEAYTPAMGALIERSAREIKRLVMRYPDFFDSLKPRSQSDGPRSQNAPYWELVFRVQVFLRLAWDSPDKRQREWYIYRARHEYYEDNLRLLHLDNARAGLVLTPPPLTPFESLMCRFHEIARSAHHCPHPECPAPYFFSRKKNQKYCSESCAAPSRREQNLRWWHESPNSPKNRGRNRGAK